MNEIIHDKPIKINSFIPIREEVVEIDAFEDSTHKKIADSLFLLITNENIENKGITIALEGAWGSGKSSVIAMLKKKIEESNWAIPLFQFDAWAHEGDPLRRIFLESLIDFIIQYSKIKNIKKLKLDDLFNKLSAIKNKISLKIKKVEIANKPKITVFGQWMSLSVITLPSGAALLSNVKDVTFSTEAEPHYYLIISVLLLLYPLIVLMICKIKSKFFKKEEQLNWSLYQGFVEQTITEEVSEEYDRTSIEFEKYFQDIIKSSIDSLALNKIVLIIDNLDRVAPEDSLKLWSTLQTFLQRRNQIGITNSWFDKVWIIVPFDPKGLESIWNKQYSYDKMQLPSKSFFDKCFQLRVDVPKPIFTGWEKYTKDLIQKHLSNLSIEDKEEIVRVLRITRKGLDDIPTPREIKNYLNQVGFLASQCRDTFSIESIAYYVIWREIYHTSVDEIRAELIKDVLLHGTKKHEAILNPSIKKELAGLLFGVSPDKGFQLLLLPEITASLENADVEKLKDLCNNHDQGFWILFKYYIENTELNITQAMNGAYAIYNSLWGEHYDKFQDFAKRIEKISLVKDHSIEYMWNDGLSLQNKSNVRKFYCLMLICKDDEILINNLYDFLLFNLENYIRNNNTIKNPDIVLNNLSTINTFLESMNYEQQAFIMESLTLNKAIQLCDVKNEMQMNIFKYLRPSVKVIDDILIQLNQVSNLSTAFFSMIGKMIAAEVPGKWEEVRSALALYLEKYKNVKEIDILNLILSIIKLIDSKENMN